MWGETTYTYNKEKTDHYYHTKALDPTRRIFSICLKDRVIGQIQLKRISPEKKEATLGIHLQKDQYKNKGYGTQALRMILHYGFTQLHLQTIYADCVKQNLRSRHVLQKIGFVYTHEDDDFYYFKMKTPL